VKVVVDNIKIFIEMLSIPKHSGHYSYSKGSTQILSDIRTSLSKCILLETVSSNA